MVTLLSNCTLMRPSVGGVALQIVLRALCLRLHLGSLKLALEWVFSWRRGRVNYLCLTDFFFLNLFVSKIYFFARCELQLMS